MLVAGMTVMVAEMTVVVEEMTVGSNQLVLTASDGIGSFLRLSFQCRRTFQVTEGSEEFVCFCYGEVVIFHVAAVVEEAVASVFIKMDVAADFGFLHQRLALLGRCYGDELVFCAQEYDCSGGVFVDIVHR